MNFLVLDIPPGIKSHGVDLDSTGQWIDGNLVRWQNGSLRPVGGWQAWTYSDAGTTTNITAPASFGVPRAAYAWFDNNEKQYLAIASYKGSAVCEPDGTVTDTTIIGFTEGFETSAENLGYGGKAFGKGTYGTARDPDGTAVPATLWALDNWGEYLVGVSEADTNLLIWKLSGDMTKIDAEADASCPTAKSLVVSQERFLFALGAGGNPRMVQWCDREDYTVWAPTATNEAGDFELSTTGAIERGIKVRGRTLIVTTTDAHVAIYQGPPVVYGFQRVGSGCGIAAPASLVSVDGGAFWMGRDAFYVYDGSKVQELPCAVLDRVFDDINRSEIRMAWGVANQRHSEVWWYYPSDGATTIDRYVSYDYRENVWTIGQIDRSAGVDLGVFDRPYLVKSDGTIYRHEIGNLYEGAEPYAETGPIMLGNGHQVLRATQLVVDERTPGDCTATFKTRFYPNGDEYEHGPYALTAPPTDVRFTGRQFRMRVTGSEGSDFRFSKARLRVSEGGRR